MGQENDSVLEVEPDETTELTKENGKKDQERNGSKWWDISGWFKKDCFSGMADDGKTDEENIGQKWWQIRRWFEKEEKKEKENQNDSEIDEEWLEEFVENECINGYGNIKFANKESLKILKSFQIFYQN